MSKSSELNNTVCLIGRCVSLIKWMYELGVGELSKGQKEKLGHDIDSLKELMEK